jgi:hypothetical protein
VTVGVLAFAPVAVAIAGLLSRPAARRSLLGLLTGAGLVFLYVAWVQRAGPGTTCWHSGSASGCDHALNPLPWAIAGLLLFLGGIVGQARRTGPTS